MGARWGGGYGNNEPRLLLFSRCPTPPQGAHKRHPCMVHLGTGTLDDFAPAWGGDVDDIACGPRGHGTPVRQLNQISRTAFSAPAANSPAARSSATMPVPPGIFSNRRIPNGLNMSSARNSKNAASSQIHVFGRKRHAAHIPTNSSETTRPGSLSPARLSTTPADQTPMKVAAAMRMKNQSESPPNGNAQYAATATALATVAGAIGAKPDPRPVPTASASQPSSLAGWITTSTLPERDGNQAGVKFSQCVSAWLIAVSASGWRHTNISPQC